MSLTWQNGLVNYFMALGCLIICLEIYAQLHYRRKGGDVDEKDPFYVKKTNRGLISKMSEDESVN